MGQEVPLVVCAALSLQNVGMLSSLQPQQKALLKTNKNKTELDQMRSRCLQTLPVPDPMPDCGFLLLSLSTTPGYFIVTKLQM